jgi:hypothetical protein
MCNDAEYSCGYSRWNTIREEIANAAVRYLQTIYEELLQSNDEENAYTRTELEKLIEYVDTNNCCTITDFGYLFIDKDFVNLFIRFDVGGVYALLNKSDDDGYYSVGNAVDIVKTFDIVDTHIVLDDVKSSVPDIKKVFEESISSGKMVHIC